MNKRGSGQRWWVIGAALVGVTVGCGGDFSTSRDIPPRKSLGRELYSLVCDRVGAQALREDVDGSSYHAICHPAADGSYAQKVDVSRLVPLDPNAVDVNGNLVSLADQEKHRSYRIARIEALGRRREDLVLALDATIPDSLISVKSLDAGDVPASCGPAAAKDRLRKQIASTLSRFLDLYNDETIPMFTRGLGRMMNTIQGDTGVQAALARMEARKGYRPVPVALGVARPALAYPGLVDLTNSLLRLVASDADPYNPKGIIDPSRPLGPGNRKPIAGAASAQFQSLLSVGHNELRTANSDPPLSPLTITPDPTLATQYILSRPRSTLEIAQTLLLSEDASYAVTPTASARYVVRRDPRGFAAVTLVGGAVPAPFVAHVGTDGKPDGTAEIDALGQFLTTGGTPPATPFFAFDAPDGPRDPEGRAIDPSASYPLYRNVNTTQTFAAAIVRDAKPLFDPDPTHAHETAMNLVSGVPVVFGSRDGSPKTSRTYPPDPAAIDAWTARNPGQTPPASVGKDPVKITYDAFHTDDSPVIDLVHALGQIMSRPEVDDALALFRKLAADHPADLARLVGLGLRMKAIADMHPEAHIPGPSMLWDDMLDVAAPIAHTPGLLEDLIKAFGDDRTPKLAQTFYAYIANRDVLTYDPNNLNGPAYNVTKGAAVPMSTPVDRTKADVGDNRSAPQKFMQLLHDANGLGACTKDGAIAHVNITWSGIPINLNYPTDPLVKVACALVGSSAPAKLPTCGVLRLPNVAALIVAVGLGRAKFDVRDDCLNKLANSPLTALVGGTDAFLEQASGIKGFSEHPTVNGVSRLVYVNTPHDGLPGDSNPAMQKTVTFLQDVLDPVPSMVCDSTPFTDTDGTVVPLRTCKSFADTIRGRDSNALFPIEQFGFIENVAPLAAAFDDHGQALLFVQLFDTMHLHWGSNAQPTDVCDPAAPKTNARWCSQDGAVTYEPLLADMMQSDLMQTLHDEVKVLQGVSIDHCEARDAATHACTKASSRDGVTVLAEALRVMIDPARSGGLQDRKGNSFAVKNDGTHTSSLTPIYLFIDALKGIDSAFSTYSAKNPDGAKRLAAWRSARSQLVDTFLSVDGSGAASAFHNQAFIKALPLIIDVARAQIAAHCPDRSPGAACAWAQTDLAQSLANVVAGPTFAAAVDLLDAIRKDDRARQQIEKLLVYLLDAASTNDAEAATLSALVDLIQVLSDDVNLTPFYRVVASALEGDVVASDGTTVQRGLASGGVEVLSRIFATAEDPTGAEICAQEIDPNRTIQVLLQNIISPMPSGETPIEVITSVVADVNRSDPSKTDKLAGVDYRNMAKEIAEFALDPASGLEQVYVVIKQATAPE